MAATTVPKLRSGTKVVSTVGLPKVPEGSLGKVIFVNGLSWIRYWVHFENGERLGQIDRSKIATVEEWNAKIQRGGTASVVKAAGGAAAAEAGVAEEKGKYGVPTRLLDMSKRARERWAAKNG